MKLVALVSLALVSAVAADDYFNSLDELYNNAEGRGKAGTRTTNCTCGLTNKERIVGGRETLKNEFPLMAGLVDLQENEVVCGATVITEYHATTASHCIVPFQDMPLGLLVGAHNIQKSDQNTKLIRVKQAIEHDEYDLDTLENDIALLVTASRIPFSKIVGPACLPNKKINLIGEFVKVIGWGYKKNEGVQSATLQKVDLKVVPLTECQRFDSALNVEKDTQICATLPKKDTCDGDSGGPLLWNDPETNRFVLVGVVSKGTICGKTPGVYTNVATFLPWIQAKIAETTPGLRTCAKIE